jgi:hypothetical protein
MTRIFVAGLKIMLDDDELEVEALDTSDDDAVLVSRSSTSGFVVT